MSKLRKSIGQNRQLKVLHVAPLPPPLGGMATYIRELTRSKLAQKVNMYVIRTDYLGKERFSGVIRQTVNLCNGAILTFLLLKSILLWRPDIVHIQTNSGYGFFEKSLLALLAKSLGRRTLIHVHGGGFRDFYYQSNPVVRRLIRWCGDIPERIVVASPQMFETWRMIGLPAERISLISNAVQLPASTIWDAPVKDRMTRDGTLNCITILFFTRIVLAKGILELIDATNQLVQSLPKLRLRIAGLETEESAQVKNHILQLGLLSVVDYVGTISEEDKNAEFLAADIYAFPTHVEDQSYAVLEAISYGLPCVATNVGGVPSIIESEVNGILVAPKKVDELAEAIKRLARDPQLRRRLGVAGRKTVKERFTWDRPADEMYALYQRICAE